MEEPYRRVEYLLSTLVGVVGALPLERWTGPPGVIRIGPSWPRTSSNRFVGCEESARK